MIVRNRSAFFAVASAAIFILALFLAHPAFAEKKAFWIFDKEKDTFRQIAPWNEPYPVNPPGWVYTRDRNNRVDNSTLKVEILPYDGRYTQPQAPAQDPAVLASSHTVQQFLDWLDLKRREGDTASIDEAKKLIVDEEVPVAEILSDYLSYLKNATTIGAGASFGLQFYYPYWKAEKMKTPLPSYETAYPFSQKYTDEQKRDIAKRSALLANAYIDDLQPKANDSIVNERYINKDFFFDGQYDSVPVLEFKVTGGPVASIAVTGPLGERYWPNGTWETRYGSVSGTNPAFDGVGVFQVAYENAGLEASDKRKSAWYTIVAKNEAGWSFGDAVFIEFPHNPVASEDRPAKPAAPKNDGRTTDEPQFAEHGFCIEESQSCVVQWKDQALADDAGGRMCLENRCVREGIVSIPGHLVSPDGTPGEWSKCDKRCGPGKQSARCIPPQNGGSPCMVPVYSCGDATVENKQKKSIRYTSDGEGVLFEKNKLHCYQAINEGGTPTNLIKVDSCTAAGSRVCYGAFGIDGVEIQIPKPCQGETACVKVLERTDCLTQKQFNQVKTKCWDGTNRSPYGDVRRHPDFCSRKPEGYICHVEDAPLWVFWDANDFHLPECTLATNSSFVNDFGDGWLEKKKHTLTVQCGVGDCGQKDQCKKIENVWMCYRDDDLRRFTNCPAGWKENDQFCADKEPGQQKEPGYQCVAEVVKNFPLCDMGQGHYAKTVRCEKRNDFDISVMLDKNSVTQDRKLSVRLFASGMTDLRIKVSSSMGLGYSKWWPSYERYEQHLLASPNAEPEPFGDSDRPETGILLEGSDPEDTTIEVFAARRDINGVVVQSLGYNQCTNLFGCSKESIEDLPAKFYIKIPNSSDTDAYWCSVGQFFGGGVSQLSTTKGCASSSLVLTAACFLFGGGKQAAQEFAACKIDPKRFPNFLLTFYDSALSEQAKFEEAIEKSFTQAVDYGLKIAWDKLETLLPKPPTIEPPPPPPSFSWAESGALEQYAYNPNTVPTEWRVTEPNLPFPVERLEPGIPLLYGSAESIEYNPIKESIEAIEPPPQLPDSLSLVKKPSFYDDNNLYNPLDGLSLKGTALLTMDEIDGNAPSKSAAEAAKQLRQTARGMIKSIDTQLGVFSPTRGEYLLRDFDSLMEKTRLSFGSSVKDWHKNINDAADKIREAEKVLGKDDPRVREAWEKVIKEWDKIGGH